MDTPKRKRLRIEFQVREVVDKDIPGEYETDENCKYVTFGDFVQVEEIQEFFVRCGLATANLFGQTNGVPCVLVNHGLIPNKISAIKIVREVTGCGLREAKDIVEQPDGSPWILFKDKREADEVLARLREVGTVSAGIRDCDYEKMRAQGVMPFYASKFQ